LPALALNGKFALIHEAEIGILKPSDVWLDTMYVIRGDSKPLSECGRIFVDRCAWQETSTPYLIIAAQGNFGRSSVEATTSYGSTKNKVVPPPSMIGAKTI
jgi:hypothetical protein